MKEKEKEIKRQEKLKKHLKGGIGGKKNFFHFVCSYIGFIQMKGSN